MKKILFSLAVLLCASAVNAQISVLKGMELFGDLKARHIGPALMSGRVTDIEGHPTDSKVIYIGTAGGGVWKSQDGGVLFNPIFDGGLQELPQSIGAVAIDPSDPDNTVWVGTGEVWTRNSVSIGDGLFKTVDGGKNWKKMGLEKTERISAVEVNPKDSKTVYVGAMGALWGDSEDRGVYKTTDGGATWTKVLYVNATTGCSELVMDPQNPNILYAAFWEFRRTGYSFNSGGINSSLYKSSDGGATWTKIHNGFPTGKLGRIAVTVAPSNSNILYAVVEAEKAEEKGLYRSDDAGTTWKHLNSDFELTVRPFYFSRISVDPKNPEVVAKAGLSGSISHDGGKTFKGLGMMHSDIHDIWFDVHDSEKLFSATDGGLYRSLNGGTTMEMIENLPICQFYHVSVDNQVPYNIYGGLQDNGSWYGPSASPGGVEARDWNSVGYGDGFRVYPHPTNPNIVYSEMQGAEGVWRYDKQIQQVKVIKPFPVQGDPKFRFNWNAAITTSLHEPDRLYIGSQFLHRSNDKGDNWVKISPDLTTNDPTKQQQESSGGLSADNSGAENHCTIFTIAESPLDANMIWVGTDDGNVQLTKDGGKTWTNLTLNVKGLPAKTWCYHIEASVHDINTAYAVFDGHTKNDMATYVYKTTDAGKTWSSIVTPDIHGFARNLQEDRINPNLLFLGTEFGLYITIDGGLSWLKFTNGVPSAAVHYIEEHPMMNDIILGTHGRGIIIIDDITPLRQLTPEVTAKKLHFFKSMPFELDETSNFGGSSGETQFVGANPSTSAKIIYYLSSRHTFGKMTLDIYDENDKWITSLSPGKQKGINIVEWGFNSMAPTVATGKTIATGAMFAPRVPAGNYKVVIMKGSERFETTVQVTYPKKSIYTLEERAKQQETVKTMYAMTEELAYMVYQIDEYLAHSEKVMKENSSLKKQAQKFNADLMALKKTLVITTGDNYVGAAEKQLREKIGDLFSTIGAYYGAPSTTQLENLTMLQTEFTVAKKRFEEIQNGQLTKYKTATEKAGFVFVTLKSFEEFVKKN
jgi:photosystem II stability/assembly factor-like uncharacterized protein